MIGPVCPRCLYSRPDATAARDLCFSVPRHWHGEDLQIYTRERLRHADTYAPEERVERCSGDP